MIEATSRIVASDSVRVTQSEGSVDECVSEQDQAEVPWGAGPRREAGRPGIQKTPAGPPPLLA